ncbi:hypothetical protein [Rhodovarius lipocyclicus]|uniref:hypothetical protein n=1 Tax=Rhodovarius lipocyclicus TaxID=268410 RepID=UPI00135B4326|nr:hypothetical protein [Rhodovarius lipocyclicus]
MTEPRPITTDELNRMQAVILKHGGSYRYAALELNIDEARLRRLIPPPRPKKGRR